MKNIKRVGFVLVLILLLSNVPISAKEIDGDFLKDSSKVSTENNTSNESKTKKEDSPSETSPLAEKVQLGNAKVNVIASSESVEVGNIAQYQIYVALDGRQTSYTNAEIKISLPSEIDNKGILFTQDLEELKIRDVVPSYDSIKKELTYKFDSLEGGFESSILLNLNTKNGSPLDGKELIVKAEFKADSITPVEEEAKTLLVANQNASLTNKLKGIMKDGELVDRLSIRYLDEAIFSVGASVNKFTTGSLALKEGSKVIISYTFAEGISYVSDTSGVTPTTDGLTYTWEFDSNKNEDDEYFFTTNFDITTKVDGDLTVFSKVVNKASITIDYVDGSSKVHNANATVMVSPNFEYELEGQYNGSAYASVFSGPSDGVGNVGWINNDDISTNDGALLGWNYYLTSLEAVNPKDKLNSYNVFFHPDENLNIRNMYSGDFYYRPNTSFAAAGLQPMEEPIYYSVSIKYADSEEWVKGKSDIVPRTYYSAEELGIDTNKKVKTLWFHFHDNKTHIYWNDIGYGDTQDNSIMTIPAGLTTTSLRIWTTVDKGYVGSVESQGAIGYSGWNNKVNRVDFQSKYVPDELKLDWFSNFPDAYESRILPKTAQIVSPPEEITRYIRSNAYFEKSKNNLLDKGENKLRLEIINDSASLSQLEGPFEAYVLVEEGIEFPDLSNATGGDVTLVDDNYNNTGKSLLKVVIPTKAITVSLKTSVIIPVNITEKVPYNVNVEMFGYYDDDYEVSDVSNSNGTFTVKEADTWDFNGNGIEEELFVTRNAYTYMNAYEFYGQLQASDDDVNFKNTVNVYDDETAKLQLTLNNPLGKPISTINLIGTLPDIDDTFVLNDTEMNSKFAMNFNGAIKVPEKYKDSFEVYYSESKEPLVAGVLDVNTSDKLPKLDPTTIVDDQAWIKESDVTDFSKMRSYKIVMKQKTKAISDKTIVFDFGLDIAEHNLTGEEAVQDRTAFSSYAVGINNASVFETQAVQFIYNKHPEYSIKADDVTMKLSDVNRMQKDGTLLDFIRDNANIVVTKNNLVIPNSSVKISFVEQVNEFGVGEYKVLYVYTEDGNEKYSVETTALLKVIDDDAVEPSLPVEPSVPEKPGEDKPDNSSKLPSAGINDGNIPVVLLAIGGILAVASIIPSKKKD